MKRAKRYFQCTVPLYENEAKDTFFVFRLLRIPLSKLSGHECVDAAHEFLNKSQVHIRISRSVAGIVKLPGNQVVLVNFQKP